MRLNFQSRVGQVGDFSWGDGLAINYFNSSGFFEIEGGDVVSANNVFVHKCISGCSSINEGMSINWYFIIRECTWNHHMSSILSQPSSPEPLPNNPCHSHPYRVTHFLGSFPHIVILSMCALQRNNGWVTGMLLMHRWVTLGDYLSRFNIKINFRTGKAGGKPDA